MSYGRINLNGNADSQDRLPKLQNERRFDFNARKEPTQLAGRVCSGCDIRRAPKEFQGFEETFKFCAVCRSRGKSRETAKR